MTSRYILIEVQTEKPVKDLLDKACGRIYTLDGVSNTEAFEIPASDYLIAKVKAEFVVKE